MNKREFITFIAKQHNCNKIEAVNIKQPEGTLAKNEILNWLFLTDRQVSIEKLGKWLESATNGEYKIVRTVTI